MTIAIDTHTHSLASGHAYSTIDELARGARERGLAGFVLTDHGPAMAGAPHPYHFGNLRVIPSPLEGVRFWKGIEANILDLGGRIDADDFILARLDFVLAGLHDICLRPGDREANTQALVSALRNPCVDAISHPGNALYPVDPEPVVRAAFEAGKALEINDSSFRIRASSRPVCTRIARLCAEIGTRVVVGSDAHYWRDVGRFEDALALVTEAGIPETQVVNSSEERFEAFLWERGSARAAALAARRPA